ncbi:DUF6124 family protein [Pseudomonas cremoricolorata]|uniref:DUF3077 domain-containing protein n=1 Tax=Pseudomonas cremoricolorata TaxID=157783 RepID=A0A089WRU3_9PSED|nr:hypothetical protein [Pseudomonas cremoricolorata]AIR91321.1 hypothetical protein LK03_19530 [Pseudomonas cremoricolorata]
MKPTTYSDKDLDSEAARRALDYYLNPTPSSTSVDNTPWAVREDATPEMVDAHVMNLLRSAAATACDSASHQQGNVREVMYALMHMINMARSLLEQKHAQLT